MPKGVIPTPSEAQRIKSAVEAFERTGKRTLPPAKRPRRVSDYTKPTDDDLGFPSGTGGCDCTDRLPFPLAITISGREYASQYRVVFPVDSQYPNLGGEHFLSYTGSGLVWESDAFYVSCASGEGYDDVSEQKRWRLTGCTKSNTVCTSSFTTDEARLELVDETGSVECALEFKALRFGADWWDPLTEQSFRILHSDVQCYQFDDCAVCVKPDYTGDVGTCEGYSYRDWPSQALWKVDSSGFTSDSNYDATPLNRTFYPANVDEDARFSPTGVPDDVSPCIKGDYILEDGLASDGGSCTTSLCCSGHATEVMARLIVDDNSGPGTTSTDTLDFWYELKLYQYCYNDNDDNVLTTWIFKSATWSGTAGDYPEPPSGPYTLTFDSATINDTTGTTCSGGCGVPSTAALEALAPASVTLTEMTDDDLDGDGRGDYHDCDTSGGGYGPGGGGTEDVVLVYMESGKWYDYNAILICNDAGADAWVIVNCTAGSYNGTPPSSPSHGDVFVTSTTENCTPTPCTAWRHDGGGSWTKTGGTGTNNTPPSGTPGRTDCVTIIYE